MKKQLLCALALSGIATAANAVVLDNGTLKIGVNDSGSLIDLGASVGIQYDPTGSSNYGSIDFLMPGEPTAFYSLGFNGSSSATADAKANSFGLTTTDMSAFFGYPSTNTGGGSYGTLTFSQWLRVSGNTIHVTWELVNESDAELNNVVFATGFDADQDFAINGDYSTNNSILGQGAAAGVSATGTASGYTISLLNVGGWSATTASVTEWATNPYALSSGGNSGNGDYTIALAYDLGNFNAGQSKTISYDISISAVPEPSSIAMLLAGLGLMGVMVRRRAA